MSDGLRERRKRAWGIADDCLKGIPLLWPGRLQGRVSRALPGTSEGLGGVVVWGRTGSDAHGGRARV
ncbi:hypothetical protein QR77_29305 [Streptomyces sp. 150FB]|nr:hypothetical protein QR77_29305 [Streptomyces sp. 150FB]